jgi:hypothetical protein
VAVSAPNHALADLALQMGQATPTSAQNRDLGQLAVAIDMIEFKYNRVGFATIDAWMC